MVVWDNSPPSPQFAGFPNKVAFLTPTSCSQLVGLSCGKQNDLGLSYSFMLTITQPVMVELKYELRSDCLPGPESLLLTHHPAPSRLPKQRKQQAEKPSIIYTFHFQ